VTALAGPIIAATILYIVLVIVVGIWSSRKIKDEAGLLVAGRSLGPILGGATLMANQVSAGTTVGIVGFHYFSGFSYAWTWPLAWSGLVIAAIFVAPKMRGFAGITLSDFFAVRFNSSFARVFSSVLIVICYAVMLSAQYQAGALLFGFLTSLAYGWALLLVASITFVYTVLGGMYSNAYLGLFKALILIAAYCCVIPFVIRNEGGLHSLAATLYAVHPKLAGGWFDGRRLISFALALGLGMAAAPYEISAFYSLTTKKATQVAIGYSFLFQTFVAIGVLSCGLSARRYLPYLTNPDLATPALALNILPRWMGALLLIAVVVTLTRAGGALLLTSASAISHDIFLRFFRPDAAEKEKLVVHRVAIAVLSLLPIGIALGKFDLVNFVILFAVKLLAATFFVPVVLGVNWRRATKMGAIAAMAGGFVGVLGWAYFAHPYFLGLEPAEAGILISLILFVAGSLLTKPENEAALEPFFGPRQSLGT